MVPIFVDNNNCVVQVWSVAGCKVYNYLHKCAEKDLCFYAYLWKYLVMKCLVGVTVAII